MTHITFAPEDPDFAERVRASFNRQALMRLIGATLGRVEAGAVDISLEYREDLTQQHGYLHAAVTTAIVDSACGYAALSLTPAGSEVLSVEFKVNLLRPAVGERFVAQGRVLKPGRTLIVVRGDVLALADGQSKLISTMLATIIPRPRAAE
ncbi:MAG TPA: PaaI family thioesterase [Pyrinomonadaceae bacterium]|nr:PaaI family thioesterase [Pyrinomonadaceae bacterium]